MFKLIMIYSGKCKWLLIMTKLEIYQKIDIYYMIDNLMMLLVNFLIAK